MYLYINTLFIICQLTFGKRREYIKQLNIAKSEKYIIKQAESLYNSEMPETGFQ